MPKIIDSKRCYRIAGPLSIPKQFSFIAWKNPATRPPENANSAVADALDSNTDHHNRHQMTMGRPGAYVS